MLAFAKIQDDIINLTDVSCISRIGNHIEVHFLSVKSSKIYSFDSDGDAKGTMNGVMQSMKLLKIAH